MQNLAEIRKQIRNLHLADEGAVIDQLIAQHAPNPAQRQNACKMATTLVEQVRDSKTIGLMESFLAEYGLSTKEGVALMCLAEALLRVPDAETIDALIEDKIAPSAWGQHLGKSGSPLVNSSTWALMLTGKVLNEPSDRTIAGTLHGMVRRLGEPIIRAAVGRAMKELGKQFVLGQTIAEAIKLAKDEEEKGFTYSYDMLGEAALTAADATKYEKAYANAIAALSKSANQSDIRDNPGISVKLSALHPRYEVSQRERVLDELVPKVKNLALQAKNAGIGLNIDAEEADRLDLSLDVIEAVVEGPELAGWDGFGVVVQAYGKRAGAVIDWLDALAHQLDRKFMVRLVKGAYWDTEIKQAQVDSIAGFPVFTQKPATDVSYICCAQKLLGHAERLYPQFATHNAHTVGAILALAQPDQPFEFQRLHGMGEVLHDLVRDHHKARCRIYAPVGAHRDLLAYLVRRLLENGANSSFVNQIVDLDIPPEEIASDPFDNITNAASKGVTRPYDLFLPERTNSKGWDMRNEDDVAAYTAARHPFAAHVWEAGPIVAASVSGGEPRKVFNPAKPSEQVGLVKDASPDDVDAAIQAASDWSANKPEAREKILNRAADLYEENAGEIFAVLCREAGKTALDAISELREAVDFLRYYGAEAVRHGHIPARGIVTCISPWNFPLAIFTGQIAAALAAGNGVLAKPAEPTPIIADIAIRLMHEAGVPVASLQLLPGKGADVGRTLTTHPRIAGICFTGSTGVAQTINRQSSDTLDPDICFIAETGGLNAMIVDSTALPEQAVQDIVESAFQSSGQRCSALRVLYLQADIAPAFLEMLYGAMDELAIGDPWDLSCDLGPVITPTAKNGIEGHIADAQKDGRLLKHIEAAKTGHFVGPAVVKVNGIGDLTQEVFGPVLHIATFEADDLDQVLDDINASGFGLTFGLHTRIDDRVEHVTSRLQVGNLYINRNQIGAIVGSQPFGGEGLSGTGPKAGGPLYVPRFKAHPLPEHDLADGDAVDLAQVQAKLHAVSHDPHATLQTRSLPGPTGESNRLSTYGRGTVLCLGPTKRDALEQARIARSVGCTPICVAPGIDADDGISGILNRADLSKLSGFEAVVLWSQQADLRAARVALADRPGPILPLIPTDKMRDFCVMERHLCIDTTAAGGNAALLAAQ